MLRPFLILLCALAIGMAAVPVGPSIVHAVEPDEILSDAALELRARHLSADLRCLVCQNQSIDDSNAPLARDLRLLVRERLQKGDSDTAVRAFIVDRYGEFVLLRPPFSIRTVLLWLTPLLLLALTLLAVWRGLRSTRSQPRKAEALSAEEQAKLDRLLKLEP